MGIHPVSLDLFDELEITEPFLEKGLKIKKGQAYFGEEHTGSIDFETHCPMPHNYILTLPQYQTEQILESELQRLEPECLVRGWKVSGIQQFSDSVQITARQGNNSTVFTANWLVGCDGKDSMVRRNAGIGFPGKSYPDTYVMGDFSDQTSFGSDAIVYIHPEGLIESFPLPDGQRRWVVKTDSYIDLPKRKQLQQLIWNRTQFELDGSDMNMISSFGVQHYLCDQFYNGRILLAGDSAHIVSPIGGQGMNLGWITASRLSEALSDLISNPRDPENILKPFSQESRKTAKKVSRRAALNMLLGRRQRLPQVRKWMVQVIVSPPLDQLMAQIFTMRGLGGIVGFIKDNMDEIRSSLRK